MGLFLCMVQRVTTVLRILKKVNGTSLSGLHPVFHSIRSPWLYADKVGVGSLGRTFRRSRNSAGAFAPAGVPSGTQCAPSLVCRISPTAAGSFTVNKKRKRYLRLKKAPFGAFCFAHVVSRSTISEQSTTRLFTLFPPSISRIVFAAVMLWSYNILSRDVNAGVDISA